MWCALRIINILQTVNSVICYLVTMPSPSEHGRVRFPFSPHYSFSNFSFMNILYFSSFFCEWHQLNSVEISFFFLFLTAAIGATWKQKMNIEYFGKNVTARVCVCGGNCVSECGWVCVCVFASESYHANEIAFFSVASLFRCCWIMIFFSVLFSFVGPISPCSVAARILLTNCQ